MKEPRVITVPLTDSRNQAARMMVSTELIDNIESARTFGRADLADDTLLTDFQRRMIAIPCHRGAVVTSMVLTISNLNDLYLVCRGDAANEAGWTLLDLNEPFKRLVGGNPQVRAVGANWTDDDRITIAVAIDDGRPNQPSRVLVAHNLSSTRTDWANIPWIDCGTRDTIRVEGIRVLAQDHGQWTIVFSGDKGPNDSLYIMTLKDTTLSSFATTRVFNPAVTMDDIYDYEVITHPTQGPGVILVGMSGSNRVLSFRAFPTYDTKGAIVHVPPVVMMRYPIGANVVEAGSIRNGGTDLYVGGAAVFLYTAQDVLRGMSARPTQLVATERDNPVRDVVVTDSVQGRTAVWILRARGTLDVVQRAAPDQPWGHAVRLRRNVQAIAPVSGDAHQKASVLVVYDQGSAGYLFQDAKTGVWHETALLVENPRETMRTQCYASSIRLVDANGLPLANEPVTITSSVLASVSVNKATVFIGPQLPVCTKTDSNGSVLVLDRVISLTPARYRFSVDRMKVSLDVDPAGGIHERFQSLKGGDLRSATVLDANGKSVNLVSEKYRSGNGAAQVDAITNSLNQVSSLMVSTQQVALGVRLAKPETLPKSTIDLKALPNVYQWGIQAKDGVVKVADNSIIGKVIQAAEDPKLFFRNMGHSITDFFEGIWDRLKEGWTFVLNKTKEAVEFICELGGKIKRFVLETLEEIGSFFTWLWNQILDGLESMWEWLKFVFDWKDILVVRDAMVQWLDETLGATQDITSDLKSSVSGSFDGVLAQIDKWRLEAGGTVKKPSTGKAISQTYQSATNPVSSQLDKVMSSSIVSWIMNKFETAMSSIVVLEPNPMDVAGEAVSNFVQGLMTDNIANLVDTFLQIGSDLSGLFGGKVPGLHDLTLDKIKEAIVMVGAETLAGIVKTLRDVVLRFIDLMADVVGFMRSLLAAKIRFPFIETLVKEITRGSVTVDTSFRIIDPIMLMFAIPATVIYKTIKGHAPLARKDLIALPVNGKQITVQAGAAQSIETFNGVAGIVAAFSKLLFNRLEVADSYIEMAKADGASDAGLSKAGDAFDTIKLPVQAVGLLFKAFGAASEYTSVASSPVKQIQEYQKGIFALALLQSIKDASRLAWDVGQKKALKTATGDQLKELEKSAKQLEKSDTVVNIGLDTLTTIMQTAMFAFAIESKKNGEPKSGEIDEAEESLAWVSSLLGSVGSSLIGSSKFAKEPTTKTAILLAGLVTADIGAITGLSKAIYKFAR